MLLVRYQVLRRCPRMEFLHHPTFEIGIRRLLGSGRFRMAPSPFRAGFRFRSETHEQTIRQSDDDCTFKHDANEF